VNWNLSTALGWLQVQVPQSSAEEAREILDSQVSDEDLAAAAEGPPPPQDDQQ
jgi:hypothetical protein